MRATRLARPRRGRGRAWIVLLLAAVSGFLLAACGVPADSSPTLIPSDQVPRALTPHSTSTTAAAGPTTGYVSVYLVGADRLIAVSVLVDRPLTIARALTALAQGPTSAEAASGLDSPASSAAPIVATRSSPGIAGTVVTVNMGPSFTKLGGQNQILAAAQVVFTVTAFPYVAAVRLKIAGKAASIPTASGSLSSRPLTRTDYAKLAPV